MKTLYPLIKREIRDLILVYVLALILGISMTVMIAWQYLISQDQTIMEVLRDLYGIILCLLGSTMIAAMVLGGLQVGMDRQSRVSSFLCTLSPSRAQLLIAKWCAGLAWFLLVLLPIWIFSWQAFKLTEYHRALVGRIAIGLVVMGVLSYSVGQWIGFSQNKWKILLGSVLGSLFIISLLLIKGFTGIGFIIMLLLTFAILARNWTTFHNSVL